MQAAPASSFASVYPVNNGPGTNTGVNNNNDIFTTIAANLDFWSGGTSQQVLTSPAFGAALNATDQFFAGMADSLTAGLSTRARTAIYGQTASQNHQGEYFQAGQTTGTLLNLAIGCGNPCSMSSVGAAGFRTLNGIQAVGGAFNAGENFVNGKPLQAGVDLLSVAGNLASLKLQCFIAGTPIRTPMGWLPIEEIRVADLVLSRSEDDPEGAIKAKVVEEVFIRKGLVCKLWVGGQEIGTTAEHPFYVYNRGWVAAGGLKVGDLLCCEGREWQPVEDLLVTGEYQTVYNMRVADSHTYFVGLEKWGFSVWVHNAAGYDDVVNSGAQIINNNVTRKNPKVDLLFNNKNEAQNWAIKYILGKDYRRINNAEGKWIGWSNNTGDTVYWGHADWGQGVGSSSFPHLNFSLADGTKGHLFLQDKIVNRGMWADFASLFGL